jgi:hypothetical protein
MCRLLSSGFGESVGKERSGETTAILRHYDIENKKEDGSHFRGQRHHHRRLPFAYLGAQGLETLLEDFLSTPSTSNVN